MSPPRQHPAMGGYYRNSSYGFNQQTSVIEEPQEGQYYSHPQQRMRQPLQPSHNNTYQNGHTNGAHPQESPMWSAHSHQQSYETMTSGSDENSKSTNPSSLNSSFDQLHQLRKPEAFAYQQQQQQQQQPNWYADEMSFAPVSPQRPYDQYGRNGSYGTQNGQHYGGPVQSAPAPPPKETYRPNNPRQPIKLDSGANTTMPPTLTKTESNGGKRQSWLKRKLSRKHSK